MTSTSRGLFGLRPLVARYGDGLRASYSTGRRLKYAREGLPSDIELVDETTDAGEGVVDLDEYLEGSIPQNIRHIRDHPDMLAGKAAGNRTVVLDSELAKVIQKESRHVSSPKRLRLNAASYYADLASGDAHKVSETPLDVETHLKGVFLRNYASLHQVLSETRRRLGDDWRPNKVLEVGFGPATGMVVLNELFGGQEWDPERKMSVIIGHPHMKKKAQELLELQTHEKVPRGTEFDQDDDLEPQMETEADGTKKKKKPERRTRTMIKDKVPAANSLTKYDLIIATHQLWRSGFHFPTSIDEHTRHLVSMLAPGGVLVFVERGDPYGFESIARARQVLIRPEDQKSPEKVFTPYKSQVMDRADGTDEMVPTDINLKVLAPCSHHGKCPWSLGYDRREAAVKPASVPWCHFGQVVQRPRFTQELKKGRVLADKWDEKDGFSNREMRGAGRPYGRGQETASFSYLIVQREGPKTAAQAADSWPRLMQNPMIRQRHVTMQVCAPSSKIEQWTVTKSFDRQAYRDSLKVKGGDLWPHGAKSVQARDGIRAKVLRRIDKNLGKPSKSEVKSEPQAEPELQDPSQSPMQDSADDLEADAARLARDMALNAESSIDASWGRKTSRSIDAPSTDENDLDSYFSEVSREHNRRVARVLPKLSKSEFKEKRRKASWLS